MLPPKPPAATQGGMPATRGGMLPPKPPAATQGGMPLSLDQVGGSK